MNIPGVDLCAIPAGVPPEGQLPNFVNPDNLTAVTIAICVTATVLATLFATVRIFTNRRSLKLGDYFVLVGVVFDIGFTGVVLAIAPYYRHFWDVPVCWINARYMKITFSNTTLVGPALYFSKTSILLMFLQVFSVQKKTRILIYSGLVATFLIYFPSIPLSAIFDAPRVGHGWEELITNGEPPKLIYWGVVQGSLAIALDIYILILPLPILKKLNLPARKRVQLAAVFATAILGVASSIVALYFRVVQLHTTDLSWNQAGLGMAVVIENNAAIIVASMPAFASFMRNSVFQSQAFKSLQSRLYSGQSKSSTQRLAEPFQQRKLETFGSPRHRGPEYLELTDSTLLVSQPTLSQATPSEVVDEEHADRKISRTTEITQKSHRADDLTSNHV